MADAKGSKKATILVVDDTPDNLALMSGLLHDYYKVVEADGGGKALNIAMSDAQPDLILLDVMMPEMDGYEVCRQLKAHERTRAIPVIFLAGENEVTDKTHGLELGAVDYIAKPINPLTVLARVKAQMAIKNAQDFIRNTLGLYMSEDAVEKLLESPDGLKLDGETRVVTALMCDLRGFFNITENLAPEAIVSMLNIFFNEMTGIIFKYSGTINAIMGDGLVAIFGAPQSGPDDPDRALACALEMQLAMGKVNAKNKELGFPALEIGIGITTGGVVVGNIGSEMSARYTAIGENINFAGKIESFSVGGQVLVSDATLKTAALIVKTRNKFAIPFRGLSNPIEISEVSEVSGKYNIALPETEIVHTQLAKEILVSFEIFEGKVSSGKLQSGGIVSLASKHAIINHYNVGRRAADMLLVKVHADLKIIFPFNDRTGKPAEIFTKVIQKLGYFKFEVRFTSISDEVNAMLEAIRAGKTI